MRDKFHKVVAYHKRILGDIGYCWYKGNKTCDISNFDIEISPGNHIHWGGSLQINHYRLTPFPDFCAALILSNLNQNDPDTFLKYLEFFIDFALLYNYTRIYVANRTDKEATNTVLNSAGFRVLDKFVNRRGGGRVELLYLDLTNRNFNYKEPEIYEQHSDMVFTIV